MSPIVPRHIIRYPSYDWWKCIEDKEDTSPIGTRFLIQRNKITFKNQYIVHDFITTHVDFETIHGYWIHTCAIYFENDTSPYLFEYDRFTNRSLL